MVGGRIYRILEVFTNLVYLNFLWLLASLPVVTIPVSTTAMFGIVREWGRGDEPPITRRFVSLLRENLRQGLVVGGIWVLAGAVLVLDLYLIGQMESLQVPLYVALFALVLLYVCASVYLFPVMANYDTSVKNVLKNALLFPLVTPLITIQCLLVVGVAVFVTLTLPVTILISGSATACAVYFFCERGFRKVEAMKGSGASEQDYRREGH